MMSHRFVRIRRDDRGNFTVSRRTSRRRHGVDDEDDTRILVSVILVIALAVVASLLGVPVVR